MSNLVLIGYRGCGKTTVGRLLAERLGYALVDTDELIVECAGKSIADIFAADGEVAFRDTEAEVIAENLTNEQPQTIALVLSHLTPELSAAIISFLPAEIIVQVGFRLGMMDRVTSDALNAVEEGVKQRFSAVLENKFLDRAFAIQLLVQFARDPRKFVASPCPGVDQGGHGPWNPQVRCMRLLFGGKRGDPAERGAEDRDGDPGLRTRGGHGGRRSYALLMYHVPGGGQTGPTVCEEGRHLSPGGVQETGRS